MGKFQDSLVTQYKKNQEIKSKQSDLKKKYNIPDENVVVVEKNNMIKFIIRTAGIIIRTAATIYLLILAAAGLLTILYPEIRTPFLGVINTLTEQFFSFFP